MAEALLLALSSPAAIGLILATDRLEAWLARRELHARLRAWPTTELLDRPDDQALAGQAARVAGRDWRLQAEARQLAEEPSRVCGNDQSAASHRSVRDAEHELDLRPPLASGHRSATSGGPSADEVCPSPPCPSALPSPALDVAPQPSA